MTIAYVGFSPKDVKPWDLENNIQDYDAVICKLVLSKSCRPFQNQYDTYLEQLTHQSPESRTTNLLTTGILSENIINEILEEKLAYNKKLREPPAYKSGWSNRRSFGQYQRNMGDMKFANDSIPRDQAKRALENIQEPKFGYGTIAAQIAHTHNKPFILVKGHTPFTLEGEIDSYTALKPILHDIEHLYASEYVADNFRKATAMAYQKIRQNHRK